MNTLAPLSLVSLITVLLAMVILAVISRLYNQSWLEPGSFFLVVWFCFIVLPLIMAPENPIYPFSIWYIFSFAVAILLGSAVWNKVDPATRLGKALTMGVPLDRYANILFNFTLIFTAISIAGLVVLILSGMSRYNLTFDLFSLSSLPNLFYVDRDTGIFTLSWSVKGLMYLVYTAALLGGITYRLLQEWKRYFCLLPLLIALFYGLTLAVRSGIMLSIILWFSGWCGAKVYMKDQTFKIKTVGLAVVSLIFFVFIFNASLSDERASRSKKYIFNKYPTIASKYIYIYDPNNLERANIYKIIDGRKIATDNNASPDNLHTLEKPPRPFIICLLYTSPSPRDRG